MRFGCVPDPLGAMWADARALLDRAVVKGGNAWADVEQQLADGRAQLWVTLQGKPINATVTRMDGKTIEVWLCGGRVLPDAVHFLETILQAASDAGATGARIWGRKGWARVLSPFGWRQEGELLTKTWG